MDHTSRREFLKQCTHLTAAGCIFCSIPLLAGEESGNEETLLDLKEYTYCGFRCEPDCPLFKATKENDIEAKRKVYEEWKMKESSGIEFDPETVSCWGCKVDEEKMSLIVKKCMIRPCAMKRELESCIQCEDLKTCEQDLWKHFPEFKKNVEKLQEKYLASQNNTK
jgi:hypothetical protein